MSSEVAWAGTSFTLVANDPGVVKADSVNAQDGDTVTPVALPNTSLENGQSLRKYFAKFNVSVCAVEDVLRDAHRMLCPEHRPFARRPMMPHVSFL